MAKSKKSQPSIPNKNIHLRLSFLYEAATFLDESKMKKNADGGGDSSFREATASNLGSAQSRHLISHMKGVGRKSVIRLNKDVKRSVCKGCDQLLMSEQATLITTENKSKGQSKPWADVRVVECRICGTSKRFPIGIGLERNAGVKEVQ